MSCQFDVDAYIITAKWYARPALVSPHGRRIEHRHGSDDNGSTTGLNVGPTVMNNATDG